MCVSPELVLRSQMVCEKKLLHSLDVRARMLRYLFPDGRRAKSGCEGCVWSAMMLVAFRMQHVI